MRAFILCLLTFSSILLAAQTPEQNGEIATVSLCELTAHPERYHGKVVRVRGTYRTAFEAAIFENRQCEDKRVWVDFSGAVEERTDPRVLRRWSRAFRESEQPRCDNAIVYSAFSADVTFIARFYGIKPSTKVLGRTYTSGYGHLNAYDYELTVLEIDRVGRVTEHVGADFDPPGTFIVSCGMADRLPL